MGESFYKNYANFRQKIVKGDDKMLSVNIKTYQLDNEQN